MEKPIIFSTPMVQAIFAGRKTQTRRVIDILSRYAFDSLKMNPICCHRDKHGKDIIKRGLHAIFCDGYEECAVKARYQPGDILWVRETWCPYATIESWATNTNLYAYKADFDDAYEPLRTWKWHSPIHMPRAAARIFLRVTDVRAERLHEMREVDALAEGVNRCPRRRMYSQIWDSLNAKRGFGWDTNPWVWVIAFERVVTS